MRVGSLFSGIGGIDLGLERAGMEIAWQCEADDYCRKVLAKHWPGVPCYPDVRSLPDDIEPVDLVCGGYPCQPFSLAGRRSGTDDPRHLWPVFASTLRLLRPEWALLENVPGHLSLGFGDVLGDLATLGYDTEWTCIPAAAVGAPHLRWRLFVLAYANEHGEPGQPLDAFAGPRLVVPNSGRPRRREDARGSHGDEGADEGWAEEHDHVPGGLREDVADTTQQPQRESANDAAAVADRREAWEVPGCGGWWAVEPDVGRVAHGVPRRVDRLRALGNAVVPQVAELIGQRILRFHVERCPSV